jgi:hypothetical protein
MSGWVRKTAAMPSETTLCLDDNKTRMDMGMLLFEYKNPL